MNRAEILAHNSGVAALAQIAAASADALQERITAAPTRFNFAIGALEGIVEAAGDLMLPLPPDATEPMSASTPRPLSPVSGASAQSGDETRCKEVSHGC